MVFFGYPLVSLWFSCDSPWVSCRHWPPCWPALARRLAFALRLACFGSPMVFCWFPCSSPLVALPALALCWPVLALWFSCGFLWLSFLIVFLCFCWFPFAFPLVDLWISLGFPLASLWFPFLFPFPCWLRSWPAAASLASPSLVCLAVLFRLTVCLWLCFLLWIPLLPLAVLFWVLSFNAPPQTYGSASCLGGTAFLCPWFSFSCLGCKISLYFL